MESMYIQPTFFVKSGFLFHSSHFSFLIFGHFWQRSYENMKILHNLCLHFARQDVQVGKKWKENHATKDKNMDEQKSFIYQKKPSNLRHFKRISNLGCKLVRNLAIIRL